MTFRVLQKKDIPACKEIWAEIFDDTPEFIDWFFANRFIAELGVCCEDNGKIISVIHGYPMPVKYFDKARKGAMMSGVATLPSHRGQGLMHKLIKMFTENLLSLGFDLIVYKAADPKIYYSCDHYPCTMRGHFTYESNGISTAWPDFDHSVPYWDMVFELGFKGLLDNSEKIRNSKEDLSEEELSFIRIKPTLKFKAYAVQMDGFTTPDDAWDAVIMEKGE